MTRANEAGAGRSLDAAEEALSRLRSAVESDLHQAFVPLGEALWWVVITEGLVGRHVPSYRDHQSGRQGQVLPGLRHARNIVAHGVNPARVLASEVSFFPESWESARWLRLAPATLTWVGAEDLPPSHDGRLSSYKLERAYESELAGGAVIPILEEALEYLAGWRINQDPGPPASRGWIRH